MSPIDDAQSGPRYWRSLEELADSPQFRAALAEEFADYDPDEIASMSRRRFLKLMGASLSLAGLTLTGCRRQPEERIAPFATRPAGRVPGKPELFATTFERGGVGQGVLTTAFDGRPVKLEGNPMHPTSLGATDATTQALVLELYDPQRAKWVHRGAGEERQRSSWDEFLGFARRHFGEMHGGSATRMAILSEASSSPTATESKAQLLATYPGAKWYAWEPINRDNAIAGAKAALGQAARPQYDITKAKVIACFDDDLLHRHPAALRHARQWAEARRSADDGQMNRVYVAESGFSLTGSVADERLPIRSGEIATLLSAVAARLGVSGAQAPGTLNGSTRFIETLVADLGSHLGESIVTVGDNQPAEVHALVWAINSRLGNLGQTIQATEEPLADDTGNLEQITELTNRINAGEIDTLVVLGGNPAYDAPADLGFAEAIAKVDTTVHLSVYVNETTTLCDWQLPKAHWLEAWGDTRAWDGTVSVQQPLILPIFEGRSTIELLSMLTDDRALSGYDLTRRTFEQWLPGDVFERAWKQVLHDGVLERSAFEPVAVNVGNVSAVNASAVGEGEFELSFVADRRLYDGRHANNGWLQETPEPMTKLTWDNAVLMNIADAKALGVEVGDTLQVTVGERSLEMPVYPMPGQARGSAQVWLGFGRKQVAPDTLHIGDAVGYDTYTLRTSDHPHTAPAKIARAGGGEKLALTSNHYLIDEVGMAGKRKRVGKKGASGEIIREASLNDYLVDPRFVDSVGHHIAGVDQRGDVPLQLWDGPEVNGPKRPGGPAQFNEPHAWGMAVDLNSCTGCSACVVACQAENNVPVVGKEQVKRSREMHWLRADRYFKTDPTADPDAERPEVAHMPVMCQQCENAPCEQVCPVAATVHDTEGLNTMVYNRCIGTRYCSNNCPYKVRRFNYFDFHAKDVRWEGPIQDKPWLDWPDTEPLKEVNELKRMVFNPEVTVRMRGVMEKCTYCTQRIAAAKIDAKVAYNRGERDDEFVNDGDIVTACQQACPTGAIVFGDLNDPDSEVSKLQANDRAYGVLALLNTRPRTMYLAKIRNPVATS